MRRNNDSGWFGVDRDGLAQILDRRGKEFAIFELISNAWDTRTRQVDVRIDPVPGRAAVDVQVVDDDPDGFRNLAHAFTLFAPSDKKADATLRGRFNLGEKFCLAIMTSATISSTTGTVEFTDSGRRMSRVRRQSGSEFTGRMRMTRDEHDELLRAVRTLIVPAAIVTTLNGDVLPHRRPVAEFSATLPTEGADETGALRRTKRRTGVRLHEVLDGEKAHIYELGIPVVEVELPWHVDVQQKVPLSMERDSVPPAFQAAIRTAILNAMHGQLTAEHANAVWVRDALGRSGVTPEAVRSAITARYGHRAVIYDPSDREANKIAVSQGYKVVHGGELSKEEWMTVKAIAALLPAGQVTPSPKVLESPDARATRVSPERYTPGMARTVRYTERLAASLIGNCTVGVMDDVTIPVDACYGQRRLTFNVGTLGWDWFDEAPGEKLDALILHELAHEFESDHLSSNYYDAICRLGARLKTIALTCPEMFNEMEE